MANIGDRLPVVEDNMQRIDDFNINFKYINCIEYATGEYGFNESCHALLPNNGMCEFYFYGSLLRILGTDFMTKFDVDLRIDNEDYVINIKGELSINQSQIAPGRLLFQKLDLDKGIHHVIIKNNSAYKFEFDAIDIDGYMIYCDDNGKLYYDMTPIMTSNNTPDGYEVNASNYLNNTHLPYKVFNGTNLSSVDCWGVNGTGTGYIQLKCPNKIKISNFILINRNHSDYVVQSPKHISLYGSNDGISFNKIKEFDNIEWTKSNQTLIFQIDTKNYKYYKLDVLESTGDSLFIGELRYLLAVDDTPFYLIKDNSSNNTYNYDEENNILVEVDDTSILDENVLNNTCIYDLNNVIPLLDSLSNDLTILSNTNVSLKANAIKEDKELIISRQNLSLSSAKAVYQFKQCISSINNGNCKTVFSLDNGITWKSYDSETSSIIDLTNTITLVDIEPNNLSEVQQIEWNNLKDEIFEKGMDNNTIELLDFSELFETNKYIRFAHVLYRPSYEDKITLQNITWNIDEEGQYVVTDEVKIGVNKNKCTATATKEDMQNVKVNLLI